MNTKLFNQLELVGKLINMNADLFLEQQRLRGEKYYLEIELKREQKRLAELAKLYQEEITSE